MAVNTRIKERQLNSLVDQAFTPISFCDERIPTLFSKCHSNGDWESIGALGCVNKYYNKCATGYWEKFDLQLCCPKLTILDAKTQGITIDDEPCVSKLAILKCYKKLVSQVENNAGLTLLTITKDLTLYKLQEIAWEEGRMLVNIAWDATSQELDDDIPIEQLGEQLGHIPVEKTYRILITNSIFNESRKKSYAQQEKCVSGHGCEMPTVQEYVALCVFTHIFFQKCLYGEIVPITYGRSSTHIGPYPMIVGCASSPPARLNVNYSDIDDKFYGAAGRRMF